MTCCLAPGTVKRQRSKVRSKAIIKVRTRPKFSNFTAMDDARSWSELLSPIISHFGASILWHIGMKRQYDAQRDTTRQNQHSTGKLICKRNIHILFRNFTNSVWAPCESVNESLAWKTEVKPVKLPWSDASNRACVVSFKHYLLDPVFRHTYIHTYIHMVYLDTVKNHQCYIS